MNIAILIMAAGNSSRLGEPKQLLPFKGGTLVSYTVEQCIVSHLGQVYVVLGAEANKVRGALKGLDCRFIENKHWELGLGSSIACGVEQLSTEQVDGALIVLVDQVNFSASILARIMEERLRSNAAIVSCDYNEGSGPPTFFDAKLFQELIGLSGEPGAKKILVRHESQRVTVDFPKGNLDVDIPQDLKRLID